MFTLQALTAACQLELFDLIAGQPGGCGTPEDFAKVNDWDPAPLAQVLNALAALKVLNKEVKDGKGQSSLLFSILLRQKCLVSIE